MRLVSLSMSCIQSICYDEGMSCRIAIVQCNSTIHQPLANAERMCSYISRMPGLDIILFPELALTGYMPYDLFYTRQLLAEQKKALQLLAEEVKEGTVLFVGGMSPNTLSQERRNATFYNVAYRIDRDGYQCVQAKQTLPYYDVFYEQRYFEAGTSLNVIEHNSMRIVILICEDMWNTDQKQSPLVQLQSLQKQRTIDLICCLSASPYQLDKNNMRLYHAARVVQASNIPLAFVNAVGGQDEIVFDGASFFMDRYLRVTSLASCKEDYSMVKLDNHGMFQSLAQKESTVSIPTDERLTEISIASLDNDSSSHSSIKNNKRPKDDGGDTADTSDTGVLQSHRAKKITVTMRDYTYDSDEYFAFADRNWDELLSVLELGVKDFCSKQGFTNVHLGISGGIDSALVATIATRALGAHAVHGVLLPSCYTSDLSHDCATQLISNLAIRSTSIPIDSFNKAGIENFGTSELATVTRQNFQARVRAVLLMAIANERSSLLLTTGNKSELSVGYATLYGDMCGGLNPIGDLYKTEVFALSEYIVHRYKTIPHDILTREPSAELAEGQKDSDSLPPYDLLDRILYEIIVNGLHKDEICALGRFPVKKVSQVWALFHASEFKRYQAPPIIKISSRAFGKGRIVSLVGKY